MMYLQMIHVHQGLVQTYRNYCCAKKKKKNVSPWRKAWDSITYQIPKNLLENSQDEIPGARDNSVLTNVIHHIH